MTTTPAAPPAARPKRRQGDRIFAGLSRGAGIFILVALAGVFVFLAIEGIPGLTQPASFYAPQASTFVGYVVPLLFGTILAAVIAVIIAAPLSFGIALVISHYAPRSIAVPAAYVVDLLAAVPSVVFGLWGINVLARKVAPGYEWLYEHLGFIPFFAGPPSTTGRTILTAGIVLAIMILPIITAISREIFAQTPRLHQEAALALGATRWEMVRLTVFPYAKSGMVSAVMLGLGRALGETMAVAMVLSAGGGITFNLISSSNPASIASNIANNYKEGTPGKVSVLIATGLVLFLVTFLVNFAARWLVGRSERRMAR
ncbi:phosphate ABC transporter permease subunit PstC [Nocardioides aurantiacus]|uniref:Phosphate transport system permease protein n=1 Tax=Nocardioides aurantiacus TaxID=86796 RepID=A0A3N2CYF4_9ACTN|nr:phosphate ABC transporter permease subunit PstC [Nocardioides aurantiacus]ROR92570.1 phosphate ABC transporter membrane protein 1 (PhoT family) [Nocardioides aurantiacus]